MTKPKFSEVHLEVIHFLAEPVGSGKTTAAIEHIHLNENENHIFVSPTKVLAKEIEDRMKADLAGQPIADKIQRFTEDTIESESSVYETVMSEINKISAEEAHILIITTATMKNILPHLSNRIKSFYNVYLDEGIDALDKCKANMGSLTKDLHELLVVDNVTGAITIKDGCNKIVKLIADDNDGALGQKGKFCHSKFVRIAKMLTCGLYDVYGAIHENSISCVGMLKPENFTGFKNVTMIVAMFEQSLLAKYWKHTHHIRFSKLEHELKLRDTHKEKGPLISIYHALHKSDNASRSTLSEEHENARVIDYIAGQVEALFSSRQAKYCYAVNDYFKPARKLMPTGAKMPVKCAGLDKWKNMDNVAALATCLPETWAKDIIIKLLGETGTQFYRDWRLSGTYQTIGRCSLRVREANNPITIIVLSYEEALAIHKLFTGSKMMGQLGELAFIREQRRANKNNGLVFTQRDHVAYNKYKKRQVTNDNEPLDKQTWYVEIREPRILTLAS